MPTPLERDWKRVQDGDVPGWWPKGLRLGSDDDENDDLWYFGPTWPVLYVGVTAATTLHFAARVRWLLSKGWWIEPPTKYEECYVAAHADLGYALSATDPDEALQEACELCEAAPKTP